MRETTFVTIKSEDGEKMKKIIHVVITGILFLAGAAPLWAQIGEGLKGAQNAAKAVEKAASGNLSKEVGKAVNRASLAAKQAKLAQQLEKRALEVHYRGVEKVPSVFVQNYRETLKRYTQHAFAKEVNPYELYPNAPEGLTPETLGYYITIKDDLQVRKSSAARYEKEEQARALWNSAGFLKKIRLSNAVPEGKEAKWLASQIKPDTRYLLVGVEHNPNVTKMLTDFLGEIVRTGEYAGRQIFLFSQSYGEGFRQNPPKDEMVKELLEELVKDPVFADPERQALARPLFRDWLEDPVLFNAMVLNIPVIGLEPSFVRSGSNFWVLNRPEGMRLRHERWLQTIRLYRERYPDALFIVYAGAGHISYGKPYSLGDTLAGEKTFVTEIGFNGICWESDEDVLRYMGGRDLDVDEVVEEINDLDNVLREANRVLRIEDPKESRAIGFDARITVEE